MILVGGVGLWWVFASSSILPTFRYLVPPPAGYFPAMESNQRSPGLRARTRGRGAAVGITGLASPLIATRRLSLRPQHFGHWPLGRISPLQNLKAVALPLAVHMPPDDGTNLCKIALGLSRLGVFSLLLDLRNDGTICEEHKATGFFPHRLDPKSIL